MKRLKKISYKTICAGKQDGLTTRELWWECLRRTKEYQDDYRTYCKTREKLYGEDALMTYEKEQGQFFREKYQLAFPLAPTVTSWFDMPPDLQSTLLANAAFHSYKRGWIESVSYWLKAVDCLDLMESVVLGSMDGGCEPKFEPLTKEELKAKTAITVVIDLNAPHSKIMNEVSDIVSGWQKLRSSVRSIPKPLTKPKLAECRRQMRVYDLIKQDGWTIDQVARECHKNYYSDNKNYARRRATRDWNAAVKLIEEGGFRQIR